MFRTSLRRVGTVAILLTGCLTISIANAHAHLKMAAPAADSQNTQVKVLKLQFSEGIKAALSSVKLQDHEDHTVDIPVAQQDPAKSDTLVVALPQALAAGTYTVLWSVVSDDGHRMKGQYHFVVTP
jgi:copper resistance protein C